MMKSSLKGKMPWRIIFMIQTKFWMIFYKVAPRVCRALVTYFLRTSIYVNSLIWGGGGLHLWHACRSSQARDQTCTTAATQVTKMIMLGPQSHVPQENSSSSILLRYYFNIFSDKVDQITWYGKYGHKLTAALSTKRWNLFSFWFALTNREI